MSLVLKALTSFSKDLGNLCNFTGGAGSYLNAFKYISKGHGQLPQGNVSGSSKNNVFSTFRLGSTGSSSALRALKVQGASFCL